MEEEHLFMVCYEEIKNKVTFDCNHKLCLKRFIIIGKDKIKCPMCRKEIDLDCMKKEALIHTSMNPISLIQLRKNYNIAFLFIIIWLYEIGIWFYNNT